MRARRPGTSGRLVLAATVTTAVVAAAFVQVGDDPDADRVEEAPAPEQPVPGANPATAAPSHSTRTPAGAIAAAARFVCSGQELLDVDPLAAELAIREMASEQAADQLAEETLTQLQTAREALAGGRGPVVFRQAVIAHRVDEWTEDRARVAIWNVGVLSREGIAPPQASWAISTLDLVWERGDWRIAGETITPGPAPILDDSAPPATSAELAAELEGFVDFKAAA